MSCSFSHVSHEHKTKKKNQYCSFFKQQPTESYSMSKINKNSMWIVFNFTWAENQLQFKWGGQSRPLECKLQRPELNQQPFSKWMNVVYNEMSEKIQTNIFVKNQLLLCLKCGFIVFLWKKKCPCCDKGKLVVWFDCSFLGVFLQMLNQQRWQSCYFKTCYLEKKTVLLSGTFG